MVSLLIKVPNNCDIFSSVKPTHSRPRYSNIVLFAIYRPNNSHARLVNARALAPLRQNTFGSSSSLSTSKFINGTSSLIHCISLLKSSVNSRYGNRKLHCVVYHGLTMAYLLSAPSNSNYNI